MKPGPIALNQGEGITVKSQPRSERYKVQATTDVLYQFIEGTHHVALISQYDERDAPAIVKLELSEAEFRKFQTFISSLNHRPCPIAQPHSSSTKR